jgi:hypothetical protein
MSVVPPKAVVKSGEWHLPAMDLCGLMVSPRTCHHGLPRNAERSPFPATVDDRREDDACFTVRDKNKQMVNVLRGTSKHRARERRYAHVIAAGVTASSSLASCWIEVKNRPHS